MNEIALQQNLPAVFDGQKLYTGGRQQLLKTKPMREYGCGVVSAANVLLYLQRRNAPKRNPQMNRRTKRNPLVTAVGLDPLPLEDFRTVCHWLQRHFLPILPHSGINGLSLSLGMNRYFTRFRLPFRARWCFNAQSLPERISSMLEQDLPVILSIGPNLPFFWQKHRLNLYRVLQDGRLARAGSATGHYVTVTAMDDSTLTVSSWGQEYRILREEYRRYVKRHSLSAVSNILLITQKK